MKTFHVTVAVVDLVEAETPEDAIGKLRARLDSRGFVPLDDFKDERAFESEES